MADGWSEHKYVIMQTVRKPELSRTPLDVLPPTSPCHDISPCDASYLGRKDSQSLTMKAAILDLILAVKRCDDDMIGR